MKNIKIFLYFLIILFCLVSKTYAGAISYCAKNGDSPGNSISETSDCLAQPDIQKVTYYRIALCTSQPTAPTDLKPIDLSSCKDIFKNPSGSTITINKNVTTNLTGNTALNNGGGLNLPPGTYTYLYAEVDPSFQIQKVAYFSSTRNGMGSSSSGVKCWSLPVRTYTWTASLPVSTTCGASDAVTTGIGLTTVMVNSANASLGFVPSDSYSCDSPASTINSYLIRTSGQLANAGIDNMGTINRIAGVTALQNPLTVSKQNQNLISQLDIGYLNTYATDVSQVTPGAIPEVLIFSGGPICMYLRSYKINN